MNAKYLIRLLLCDEFDKALHIQVGLRTGVGSEGEFSNHILHAVSLKFLFSLADPGDFWVGVDDGWDGCVVNVPVSVLYVLNGSNTYMVDCSDTREIG